MTTNYPPPVDFEALKEWDVAGERKLEELDEPAFDCECWQEGAAPCEGCPLD